MIQFEFYLLPAWAVSLFGLLGTLAFAEVGYRAARRTPDEEKADSAWGVVESSILGLMAFLLGFAFSFANGRYETRLDLEQKEANAIGTAYMRVDLLDEATRGPMHELFRKYVDARLDLYHTGQIDKAALQAARNASNDVQNKIWATATDLMRRDTTLRYSLFIQALNDMFDNGGDVEENLARRTPVLLVVLIMSSVFLGGGCVGYGFGRGAGRNPSAWLLFAFITTLVIYVVLDVGRPERGLVRAPHVPLVRLQESLR